MSHFSHPPFKIQYSLKHYRKRIKEELLLVSLILFDAGGTCREMWRSQMLNDSCPCLTLPSTEGERQASTVGKWWKIHFLLLFFLFTFYCCCSLLNLIMPVHLSDRKYLAHGEFQYVGIST